MVAMETENYMVAIETFLYEIRKTPTKFQSSP